MADVVQIVVAPGSGDGRAPSTARRLQKALVRRGYETRIQTFSELERLVQWAATCEPTFSSKRSLLRIKLFGPSHRLFSRPAGYQCRPRQAS